MAPHSNTLACRIPWTEAPGGLQFMELQRVRHNLATYTHTDTLPSHHPVSHQAQPTLVDAQDPHLESLPTPLSHSHIRCASDVPVDHITKSRQNAELNLVGFLRNGSQNLIDEINLSKVKT